MWEINNRLGLLLAWLSAAALIAHAPWVVRISNWLSFCTIIWATCVTAPGFRFDIHWRSLVLYAFITTLTIICIVELKQGKDKFVSEAFRIGYGIIFLIICTITCVFYFYFPVTSNPELTGKYKKVGTTSFNLDFSSSIVDPARSSITIQCWFPIDYTPGFFELTTLLWTSGHPLYQLQEILDLLHALCYSNGLPTFLTQHLTLARTKTHWQESFANIIKKAEQAQFPVAVYSHGMYGWRQIHHTACEKLASEGFVVFACDHIPDCLLTRPLGGAPTYFDFATPSGIEPRSMDERKFYQEGLEMRVVQLTTLLAHIISPAFLEAYPDLVGRLDHDHINLWGHSFGGLTVSSLCCRGEQWPFRINSAVVLDGWLYPMPTEDREKGFHSTSLLNISADQWVFGKYQVPFRNDLVKNTMERALAQDDDGVQHVLDLVLRGAAHQNFVDIYFVAHRTVLEKVQMVGPTLDTQELIQTVNHILPAFFHGVSNLKKIKSQANTSLSTSTDLVQLEGLEANELMSKHPFVLSSHEQLACLGEICHAGRANLSDTENSLPPHIVTFIDTHIVPATAMPDEYTSYAAFEVVMGTVSEKAAAAQGDDAV